MADSSSHPVDLGLPREFPQLPSGGRGNFQVSHGQTNKIWQSGGQVSEDTRGLLESSIAVRYQAGVSSGANNAAPDPFLFARGANHPYDARLKCHKNSITYGHNGEVMATYEFIGLKQDPTIPEVEASGSTASNNVQLHPAFVDFAMSTPPTASNPQFKFKPYVDTVNNNRKDFERFNCTTAPEGLRGADSYLAPRCNVHVTFYTANVGTANKFLSNLGTVSALPQGGSGPVGGVPLPTGGNFILTSCSVSQYGTIYKVSSEWMQSEQGHLWSKYLYRTFGGGGKRSTSRNYNIGGDYTLGYTSF